MIIGSHFNRVSKKNPDAIDGFTLVELLVVIVLIAILSAVFIISYDFRSEPKQIRQFAEELRDQLILAQDESLLSGDLLGLEVFENGYRFLQWYNPLTDTMMIDEALSEDEAQASEGDPTENLGDGVKLGAFQQQGPSVVAGFWEPISDDPRRATYRLPDHSEIQLEIDGAAMSLDSLKSEEEEASDLENLDFSKPEENPFQPRLFFLPSGESLAFKLRISLKDDVDVEYVMTSDVMGRLKLVRPGETLDDNDEDAFF